MSLKPAINVSFWFRSCAMPLAISPKARRRSPLAKLQRLIECFPHGRLIFLMKQPEPLLERAAEQTDRSTDDGSHFTRPLQAVLNHVVVPGSHVAGFECQAQPLLAAFQLRQRLLRLS